MLVDELAEEVSMIMVPRTEKALLRSGDGESPRLAMESTDDPDELTVRLDHQSVDGVVGQELPDQVTKVAPRVIPTRNLMPSNLEYSSSSYERQGEMLCSVADGDSPRVQARHTSRPCGSASS